MPLPLIVYPIAARLAFVAADAWRQRRERLHQAAVDASAGDRLHLAVLGPSEVGKTTLINAWRGYGVNNPTERTHLRERHERVELDVNERKLTLVKLDDVSGDDRKWSSWQDSVGGSRFVLYLVNAQTLLAEERRDRRQPATDGWDRIEDDAGQIRLWLESGPVELCLLVITHRDLDPRFAALGESGYHQHVSSQLDPVIFKLGGDGRVSLVTGSLDTNEAAWALTAKIMEHLR